MSYFAENWLSLLYILVSVSANIGFYFSWKNKTSFLGKAVRNSRLLPVIVAIQIHWLLFFGPINIFPIFIKSDHQNLYPWVIDKLFFAQGMLAGIIGYISLLAFLLIISLALWKIKSNQIRVSLFEGKEENYPPLALIGVSALILGLAIWISPVIGTITANDGAWYKTIPPIIRWFGKGIFLVEACPLIFSGWKNIEGIAQSKSTRKNFKIFTIVAILQLLAFLALRQRFLSLLAVTFYGSILLAKFRNKRIVLILVLLLFVGYSIPSGLRYTRLSPSQFESKSDYFLGSAHAFLTGIQPHNLFSSAVADLSYNKAGAAALSVPLGIQNRNPSWHNFNWILVEFYKPLPGFLKPYFKAWGDQRSEKLIGDWLAVGKNGKNIPGVSKSVQDNWVIDMMETPFLEPLVAGGFLELSFSILFCDVHYVNMDRNFVLTSTYPFCGHCQQVFYSSLELVHHGSEIF